MLGNAGARVRRRADRLQVLRVAADAMLRPEQGLQLDALRFVQQVGEVTQSGVDARWIEDGPDAQAAQRLGLEQARDAQLHHQ